MVRVHCSELVFLIARQLIKVALGGLVNHTLLTRLPSHIDLGDTGLVAHALALFNLVKTTDRACVTALPDKVKDAHSCGVVCVTNCN